jgi:hypothetical protein
MILKEPAFYGSGDNQSGSAITDRPGHKPLLAYNVCKTFPADNGSLIVSIKQ